MTFALPVRLTDAEPVAGNVNVSEALAVSDTDPEAVTGNERLPVAEAVRVNDPLPDVAPLNGAVRSGVCPGRWKEYDRPRRAIYMTAVRFTACNVGDA